MEFNIQIFLIFIFGIVVGSLGMAQIYKEESMRLIAEIDTLQDTVIDCHDRR